jgi:hypothetical protein
MKATLTKKAVMKRLCWILSAPVFFALSLLAFRYPKVTETVYARGIYPFIVQPLSSITGLLPFSLGEILLYAALAFALFVTISTPVIAFKAGKDWHKVILRRVLTILAIASTLVAAFIGLFGMCYARLPLANSLGLNTSPASMEELTKTFQKLAEKANALYAEVQQEGGKPSDLQTRLAILRAAPSYYNAVAKKTGLAILSGDYGPIKPVLYSTGLSYALIEGIYCPITGEANINMQVPSVEFAAAALHEAAHQRGFAREDEANFLAYFVGSQTDDARVRYSAAILALTYTIGALYSADTNQYATLYATINNGVIRDINASSQFWKQHEGPVSKASATVNDNYLKANNQQLGIKSYGRIVDLLIGLNRQGGI